MTFGCDIAHSFEYGAILKGSQTVVRIAEPAPLFEYGAILKGSQTELSRPRNEH